MDDGPEVFSMQEWKGRGPGSVLEQGDAGL